MTTPGPEPQTGPRLHEPDLMARFAAYFYGSGATLVLATLALPHQRPVFLPGVVGPALAAYAIVVILVRWGARLPYWCFRLVPVAGSILVSLVAWSGRSGAPAYALLYVWAALYAFYFLGRRDAVLQVTLIAAAYAGVLAADGRVLDAQVHWLMSLGTVVVAAMWVRSVVRRLREHAEQLRQAGEEVLASEARLRGLVAELQSSNRDLEQFAYVSAHDLQEPLRMVTSYVQLLDSRYRGRLDGDADEYIGFAVEGATRMQALISDLLTYSRVGRGDQRLTDVDARACVMTSWSNLESSVRATGAELVCGPLPHVRAHPAEIRQLFQNLIGNAIKFHGEQPPRVVVTAQPSERAGWWAFSVSDNGIGIDPRHAERIFAVFQRLNSRERFEGTGIGLAICRKVVERLGGRIWVESEVGRGSSFRFTLAGVSAAPPEPAAGDAGGEGRADLSESGRAAAALSELVSGMSRRV